MLRHRPHVCGMRKNLMRLLPGLSKTERKLIADAMYDYDPGKHNYNDIRVIMLLDRDRVIAALRNFYWVHGTTAALRLAHKLQSKCRTHTSMNERSPRLNDDADLIVVAVDEPVEGH